MQAIDSFGLTDKGNVRPSNQDNFLIVDIHRSVDVRHSSLSPDSLANRFGSADAHLFVVADGVGGGPGGDYASEGAISALLKYVSETVGCFNRLESSKEHDLFQRLEETVRDVDQSLRAEHAGKRQHARRAGKPSLARAARGHVSPGQPLVARPGDHGRGR